MRERSSWKAFGPGLLFAGAAIGVSHLVQSTRAGAMFGVALVLLVILANILKYPAFSFGPRYAAATGKSLLEGYRRQGKWALILYAVLTAGTMFTVMAAVTVVTAGLAQYLLLLMGIKLSSLVLCAILLAMTGTICGVGDFRWLDRVVKGVVALLTVATLLATIMILGQVNWSGPWLPTGEMLTPASVLFMAALVGWMPSAIDISIWHSLWTLAKRKSSGHTPTVKESMTDFNVGYWGTAILALCFVLMGAAVIFGSEQTLAKGGGDFAKQVVQLYAHSLGEWSVPVIGTAAFLVMFSTTLTVTDGFPRAIACLFQRLRTPEEGEHAELSVPAYRIAMVVTITGSLALLFWLLKPKLGRSGGFGFKELIDLATTLSFLTAPILAMLNHRAVTSDEVPKEAQPSPGMIRYSYVSIVFLWIMFLLWFEARFQWLGLFGS
jgi:Mn2+/Fe2+ NRAMP family transporter